MFLEAGYNSAKPTTILLVNESEYVLARSETSPQEEIQLGQELVQLLIRFEGQREVHLTELNGRHGAT
jgi:hypothetical protein